MSEVPNTHAPTGGQVLKAKQRPEWQCHSAMVGRCHNPRNPAFPRYGGRGIVVCERWRKFANFLADMPPRPSRGHSIERINNDRGYDCGHCDDCRSRNAAPNCRWATRTEQARNTRTNRRITFDGRTLLLTDWAREKGLGVDTLFRRLNVYGWSVERALTTPLKVLRTDCRNGHPKTPENRYTDPQGYTHCRRCTEISRAAKKNRN